MKRKSWHIVVAGAGGNTGSHLLPHLVRMQGVTRLTLVDPDVYTAENHGAQDIQYVDIGQPKAAAQAARLAQIRPGLEVSAVQERIEDVPWGQLRCDLFISCLDSRAARQRFNEIAWRLGITWLDCGVLGSQELVRVNGYTPALDAPCLECAWDPGPHGEYAVLEQEFLCGAGARAFPTLGTSALGGLAASLMAFEIAKVMRDVQGESIGGRQLIYDARRHAAQVTVERRNPRCRFDHRTWDIARWPCRLRGTTVGGGLEKVASLALEGHHFVTAVVCPSCGRSEMSFRLNRPLARCATCNRRMAPADFGTLDRLRSPLPPEWTQRTLAEIGLRDGDVVSNGREHYQLTEVP